MQHDIQISGGPAELPDFACARKTDPCPIFHTRGNLGVHRPLAQNPSLAFTFRARIGDDVARTLAGGTSASDAEKSLLVADLATSVARAAGCRPLTRRRTGTVALLARLMAPNGNAGLRPEECFLELEREVFAEIGAALHPAATTPAAATAEHVAEAEKFSEYVAEVLKDRRIETCTRARAPAQSGVAVAIIDGALIGVGEHGIGFTDFLEFLFRIRIVGIAVWMELQREFAIRALEFLFRDSAGYTQHIVIVAFCVRRQNEPFLQRTVSQSVSQSPCHPNRHVI